MSSITRMNSVHCRKLFDEIDTDEDGCITFTELKQKLENATLPEHSIITNYERTNTNGNHYITFPEFYDLSKDPEIKPLFKSYFERYLRAVFSYQGIDEAPRRQVTDDSVDGKYEDQYSCCPPPINMAIVAFIAFCLYRTDESVSSILIYDPKRRHEVWRFFTYTFVHFGSFHLVTNILFQIYFGITLEMIHRWRVLVIYIAGVITSSLRSSIINPATKLAGASGGVYAVIAANGAAVLMNFKTMQFAFIHALVTTVIIVFELIRTIYYYNTVAMNDNVSYVAHCGGIATGLLLGIVILKNVKGNRLDELLRKICLTVYIVLISTAVIWNIVFPQYFPPQDD